MLGKGFQESGAEYEFALQEKCTFHGQLASFQGRLTISGGASVSPHFNR